MTYEFLRPDGTLTEAQFHHTVVPEPGETVWIEGEKCVRIISTQQQIMPGFREYHSRSLRKWLKHPAIKDYDKAGHPRMSSLRQEREVAKTLGLVED